MRSLRTDLAIAAILTILFMFPAMAQPPDDGGWPTTENSERRITPYPYVGPHDVMWSHRVWRYIDLKEKMNLPLAFPSSNPGIRDRQNLIDVIHDAVLEGTVIAYEAYNGLFTDDEFTNPIPLSMTDRIGGGEPDTVTYINVITDAEETVIVQNEFDRTTVVMFKIKEDWFFDKKRSRMDVRIIGIAPVVEVRSESGEYLGLRDLYWVYFPEVRMILSQRDVYNRWNDAERLSYDDLFHKRMFNSFIIKESNVYDRYIKEYRTGLDALLKADAIKEKIRNLEMDMWEY